MKNIRTSKFSKIIATYLALQLIITTVQPSNLFALTGGPSQPEFNSFTPIGTSDMVNLSSGDFNYNIPIMDVGGYPLNLAYDSGISMDQEASWVGLGWNLNIGQINRQVRGLPDDFNGDEVIYKNNMKPNKTKGMTLSVNAEVFGFDLGNTAGVTSSIFNSEDDDDEDVEVSLNAAITLEHNNYDGLSVTPSLGFGFNVGGFTSVGMNLSANASNGAILNQNFGLSARLGTSDSKNVNTFGASLGVGRTYNSRQGLTAFNINTSIQRTLTIKKGEEITNRGGSTSIGTSSSYPMLNQTFTPIKRNQFHNTGFSFNPSVGFIAFGVGVGVGVTAFGSRQELAVKTTTEKAFGYEFTKEATPLDILDFNRENDRSVTQGTKVLPSVNYTYDLYSIQGQGIGGQFRPYKGQVGYVYDQYVKDNSSNSVLGFEIEVGNLAHGGVDFKHTDTDSHTGVWDTPGRNLFEPSKINHPDYEETYFKATGDLSVDDNINLYKTLGEENPVAIEILPNGPRSFNREASNVLTGKRLDPTLVGQSDDTGVASFESFTKTLTEPLKRENREKRNQAILKVTVGEAANDPFIEKHSSLNTHQTNGYKIFQPDGSRYIYGEAAVNLEKKEHTFSVNSFATKKTEGIVTYNTGDDTVNNNNGIDHYYNGIETPTYAHSYLLTAVLSSDYEDRTGNGPTDDDFGAYTKFHYSNDMSGDYKWRVPYGEKDATYNPGLQTLTSDQKGSYTEGTKELKYATIIETKTHVAFIDLFERADGKGAFKENNRESQYGIEKIRLYSKPEAIMANLLDQDTKNDFKDREGNAINISPIKTAYFKYNYTLGEADLDGNGGIPNSDTSELDVNLDTYLDLDGDIGTNGRLTLKKVYFTYRDSNMGKYTPYVFHYDNFNPTYHLKSYDIWGNYKPYLDSQVENPNDIENTIVYLPKEDDITGCEANQPLVASEFPFVDQKNRALQDYFASAWTLSSIDLPSGGKIELEYESDDYQYVQDRKAMQMYKVVGVSQDEPANLSAVNKKSLENADYIVVALPNEENELSDSQFKERYIGDHFNKPIYFNFMLNMSDSSCNYEYVSGYFEIDSNKEFSTFSDGDTIYGAIPMKRVSDEGDSGINPITKAGWYFGRNNLKRFVYGVGDNSPENITFGELMDNLGSSFGTFLDIFRSPNGKLRALGVASKFKANKSWIRLQHANKGKLGGGLRAKSVVMQDNWDTMLSDTSAGEQGRYRNFYGQEYDYKLDNNQGSSGVATFEPNASRENPFVEPVYNTPESIIAPKEVNYVEKPFGQSFFPSPTVTYSRVTVSNLKREHETTDDNGDPITLELKSNATGTVVNEFFTSKNYPTLATYTDIDGPNNYKDNSGSIGNSILKFLTGVSRAKTQLVLSQGFSVVTNDMNGKSKSQKVFDERGALISGVDYKYSTTTDGRLDNNLNVIKEDGTVEKALIGVQYEVITDFRESYNNSVTRGVNVNTASFIIPTPIPIFIFIPSGFYQDTGVKNIYRGTTTTKHVHKTGVLVEKEAYDLGATVKTKNLAWDAVSGQVLLTETINEYDDNYYNFTYPAHWMYEGMGQASQNLGVECVISNANVAEAFPNGNTPDGENPIDIGSSTSSEFTTLYKTACGTGVLNVGDEVRIIKNEGGNIQNTNLLVYDNNYWVSGVYSGGFVSFINKYGSYLNPCGEDESLRGPLTIKVVNSRFKNLQTASMASITSMTNPITDNVLTDSDFQYDGTGEDPKIVNASAIEYSDFWQGQNSSSYYPNDNGVVVFNTQQSEYSLYDNKDPYLGYPKHHSVNPFIRNIKNQWRAISSYAYLTGRSNTDGNSPRNSGFFTSFDPYFVKNGGGWQKNYANITQETDTDGNGQLDNLTGYNAPAKNWTFASKVTRYDAYGMELENKDALNRYSSALYGYDNTLPTSVASNTEYRQLFFNGFEEFYNTAYPPFSNSAIEYKNEDYKDITAHTGMRSLEVLPTFAGDAGKGIFTFRLKDNTDCTTNTRANELNCAKYNECGNININYQRICVKTTVGPCTYIGATGAIYCFEADQDNETSEDQPCNFELRNQFIISNLPSPPSDVLIASSDIPLGYNYTYASGTLIITQSFGGIEPSTTSALIPDIDIYYSEMGTALSCCSVLELGGTITTNSGNVYVNLVQDGNILSNFRDNVSLSSCDATDEYNSSTYPVIIAGEPEPINTDPETGEDLNTSDNYCYPKYLLPAEKYVVSAWVNSNDLSPTSPSGDIGLRLGQSIRSESGGWTDAGLLNIPNILPSGGIIDGWQRIIGIVEIPQKAEIENIDIYHQLYVYNHTNEAIYLDDVRMYPYNGTMKSFVYDQGTQRLLSELDENNYATFYEYDKEGGLIRVKKETERGIYTIQETRSNTIKKENND